MLLAGGLFAVAVASAWWWLDEPEARAVRALLSELAADVSRRYADPVWIERRASQVVAEPLSLRVAERPHLAPGRDGLLELLREARAARSFELDVSVTSVELGRDRKRARALAEVSWQLAHRDRTLTGLRKLDVMLERQASAAWRIAAIAVAPAPNDQPEARP
jgi:hypothetical protein